jgi:glycosylphosphatidylinositol transamidase (GPIT) subunit GPI8
MILAPPHPSMQTRSAANTPLNMTIEEPSIPNVDMAVGSSKIDNSSAHHDASSRIS